MLHLGLRILSLTWPVVGLLLINIYYHSSDGFCKRLWFGKSAPGSQPVKHLRGGAYWKVFWSLRTCPEAYSGTSVASPPLCFLDTTSKLLYLLCAPTMMNFFITDSMVLAPGDHGWKPLTVCQHKVFLVRNSVSQVSAPGAES